MPPLTHHRVPLEGPQAVEALDLVVHHPEATDHAREPAGAAVLIAHGAGTDRDHPSIVGLAEDLAAHGHVAGRVNFPFTEAGRRRPDPMPRLEAALAAAASVLASTDAAEGRSLVLAGRSMGGRVASRLAADGRAAALGVAGIACLAYPLHPAGRPERLRTDHWPAIRIPLLLVNGARDALADLALLQREVVAHLDPSLVTLHVLAGADHSLRPRKVDGRTIDEVAEEARATICDWVAKRVVER